MKCQVEALASLSCLDNRKWCWWNSNKEIPFMWTLTNMLENKAKHVRDNRMIKIRSEKILRSTEIIKWFFHNGNPLI